MYRTIIVDDETAQQELLHELIRVNFPHLSVMAICSGVDEALEVIPRIKPDLIFLDVKMPPKTGFDLLRELGKIDFAVIFTSSYEHFAIQAFRVSAIDYLLKPIRIDDMREALSKFESTKKTDLQSSQIQNLLSNLQAPRLDNQRIALGTSTGLLFVQASEIIRCSAERHLIVFFFTDKSQVVVSKSLKECEDLLVPFGFIRIHQSHLVNIAYIRKYIKGDGGHIELQDGTTMEVSRRKKDELLAILAQQ